MVDDLIVCAMILDEFINITQQNKYQQEIGVCVNFYNKFFETMQQYTNHAINYAGHYINAVKQWWWPPAPVPQTPLQQLKFYLQNSNMQFNTKHSQQKIVIQRICMMYNQLISANNNKYANFKSTIEKPIQYIQPVKNIEKIINKQQQLTNIEKKSIVSIVGSLKIKADKIKCDITITLVLHEDIQNKLPIIYIRNPDVYKVQPNPQYIQQNKIYQSILGGVTLLKENLNKLQIQWKTYKSQNILNLVKQLQKILTQSFPFAKRFTTFQSPDLNSSQFRTLKKLNTVLHQSLQKIQSSYLIKQCIISQRNYLIKQNKKLKDILQESNKLKNDINSILKMFKVSQNQQILDLVCSERSYVDCIKMLQNQVEKGGKNKSSYEQQIQILKDLSSNLFEVRFKIFDIIHKMQHEKQQTNEKR